MCCGSIVLWVGFIVNFFVDCKTVRIFAYFKYAPALKQKVWNEAENREQDWGERLGRDATGVWGSCGRLLHHTLPISLLILREKKTTVLQSIFLFFFSQLIPRVEVPDSITVVTGCQLLQDDKSPP